MPDINSILDETAETLKEIAAEFLEGTAEDLQLFVEQITFNLLSAQALGRQDLVDNNLGQLRMIGEATRLRAEVAKWKAFQSITQRIIGLTIKALITAVV